MTTDVEDPELNMSIKPKKTSQKLGHFIEKRRKKLSLSRLALAKKSHVSDAYLCQIEQGKYSNVSPRILKNLVAPLDTTMEELLEKAGYINYRTLHKKTIILEVKYIVKASRFAAIRKTKYKIFEIDWDLVKDIDAFSCQVEGNCMTGIGIYDGDLIVVSPNAKIENEDIIIIRIGDEIMVKKYTKQKGMIILMPCNNQYNAIVIDPDIEEVEILGRVKTLMREL